MTKPGWRVSTFLDGVSLPPPGRILLDPNAITWRVRDHVEQNGTRHARLVVNGGSSCGRTVDATQVHGWEVLP